jgi:adenosylcobinamide-phosphate synthase
MSDLFSIFYSQIMDPDRFPVLLMAMLLTAISGVITGPMHGNANPFYWKIIDIIFGKTGSRLDNRQRASSDLIVRGFMLTIIVLPVSYAVGEFSVQLAASMPFHGITQIILLSLLLTSGTVWFSLLRLFFALKEDKVAQGSYYTIAQSARTDLSGSDDYGITRAGMSYAARAFDKGLVAPAIWYLIAGLPGAFIYSGVSALAWRFGKDGFSKGFGFFALALEKLLGFVPMVFSGTLLALAGLFTPTGGMTRALIALLKPKNRAKYAEGGLPVTAIAYSLDVSLGGPVRDLEGSTLSRDWIGPKSATAQLDSNHLRRTIYISVMAWLLFVVSLLFAMLYAG